MLNRIRIVRMVHLVVLTLIVAPTVAKAEIYRLELAGSAHWINDSGVSRYSAEAVLCAELTTDNQITLTTPPSSDYYIRVNFKRGEYATFKIDDSYPLSGTKSGNQLTFVVDENDEHAKAYYSAKDSLDLGKSNHFAEIFDGVLLTMPVAPFSPAPWDGTWSRKDRVDIDGDIYRAPDEPPGYLDILFNLIGQAIATPCP